MDRRSPIILLIEHDDIDRTTLFRMLADRGYRVMAASRGVDALDTFVFHHSQIALVLSNARLPDIGSAQLCDALHRIDPRVPVIAARHPAHAPHGAGANRSLAFAGLMTEVDSRVFHSSADRHAFAESHGVLSWPVCDEELDEIEGVEDWSTDAAAPNGVWRDLSDRGNRGELLEPVTGPSNALKSIAPREIRNYLAAQGSARRRRRRRIGRVAALIAIVCAVAVTMLMQVRMTRVRAIEADGPDAPGPSDHAVAARLSSSAVTDLIGTVRLIPAERVSPSVNLR